jgi:hypothetical protein
MKSILFKDFLFKQVVTEKKKQTRRVIFGLDPDADLQQIQYKNNERDVFLFKVPGKNNLFPVKPKYSRGDILYLKEPISICNYEDGEKIEYLYHPSTVIEKDAYRWENKLFMKEIHARYFIRITDVFVEILNNITTDDAIAEGVEKVNSQLYKGSTDKWDTDQLFFTAKAAFADIWNSINAKWSSKQIEIDGTKEKHFYCYPTFRNKEMLPKQDRRVTSDRYHVIVNPWVIRYRFELISKEEVYNSKEI